jgi:predicted GTPase
MQSAAAAQISDEVVRARLLDEIGAFFQEHPDRLAPPMVVAVTHIDQLRPLSEWDPPYDLARPAGAKAEQILDATRAVEEDLDLTVDQPVVPVCLKPGALYNVDEGVAAVILQLASEAQRVKYLRCLRHYRDEASWQRVWQQAVNSGRVLLKAGAAWTGRKLRG